MAERPVVEEPATVQTLGRRLSNKRMGQLLVGLGVFVVVVTLLLTAWLGPLPWWATYPAIVVVSTSVIGGIAIINRSRDADQ